MSTFSVFWLSYGRSDNEFCAKVDFLKDSWSFYDGLNRTGCRDGVPSPPRWIVTDHGEATMDLEILTRRSLDVFGFCFFVCYTATQLATQLQQRCIQVVWTIKCHEPRTSADSEENLFNKRLHEKYTTAARGSRQPAGSSEPSAVVFPQVRFLKPWTLTVDPVDPPSMKVLTSLKMCTLCDHAFPFVTLEHRLHTRRAHATPTRAHSLLYNFADLDTRYRNNVQKNNPNSPCCAVLWDAVLWCDVAWFDMEWLEVVCYDVEWREVAWHSHYLLRCCHEMCTRANHQLVLKLEKSPLTAAFLELPHG